MPAHDTPLVPDRIGAGLYLILQLEVTPPVCKLYYIAAIHIAIRKPRQPSGTVVKVAVWTDAQPDYLGWVPCSCYMQCVDYIHTYSTVVSNHI